jgi:hypothetical protein
LSKKLEISGRVKYGGPEEAVTLNAEALCSAANLTGCEFLDGAVIVPHDSFDLANASTWTLETINSFVNYSEDANVTKNSLVCSEGDGQLDKCRPSTLVFNVNRAEYLGGVVLTFTASLVTGGESQKLNFADELVHKEGLLEEFGFNSSDLNSAYHHFTSDALKFDAKLFNESQIYSWNDDNVVLNFTQAPAKTVTDWNVKCRLGEGACFAAAGEVKGNITVVISFFATMIEGTRWYVFDATGSNGAARVDVEFSENMTEIEIAKKFGIVFEDDEIPADVSNIYNITGGVLIVNEAYLNTSVKWELEDVKSFFTVPPGIEIADFTLDCDGENLSSCIVPANLTFRFTPDSFGAVMKVDAVLETGGNNTWYEWFSLNFWYDMRLAELFGVNVTAIQETGEGEFVCDVVWDKAEGKYSLLVNAKHLDKDAYKNWELEDIYAFLDSAVLLEKENFHVECGNGGEFESCFEGELPNDVAVTITVEQKEVDGEPVIFFTATGQSGGKTENIPFSPSFWDDMEMLSHFGLKVDQVDWENEMNSYVWTYDMYGHELYVKVDYFNQSAINDWSEDDKRKFIGIPSSMVASYSVDNRLPAPPADTKEEAKGSSSSSSVGLIVGVVVGVVVVIAVAVVLVWFLKFKKSDGSKNEEVCEP